MCMFKERCRNSDNGDRHDMKLNQMIYVEQPWKWLKYFEDLLMGVQWHTLNAALV